MAARILVLCLANVARSPLLAARLHLEVAARGLDGEVAVASAGVDTVWGLPVAEGSRVVADRWGVDLDGHQSRPLAYLQPAVQDLVLTMERRHTRSVLSIEPALAGRVFTAPELARILADPRVAEQLPSASETSSERLRAAVALADGHRPSRWQHRGGALEVADPVRQGQEVYDRLGELFVTMAADIAEGLFGPRTAHRSAGAPVPGR